VSKAQRKYLIINADDCGMCHSANAAVFELFEGGYLKSSTIMTPCPGAEEAVAYAAAHPEFAFGVHLTHTNEWRDKWPWGSLTGGKTLENEDGRMWPESEDFEKHCDEDEAMAESKAQIEFCESRGMKPSHVDSHMGAVYGLNGRYLLLPKTIKLCGQKGYPFRMFSKPLTSQCPPEAPMGLFKFMCRVSGALSKLYKVPMPDYLIFPEQIETGETYEEFKRNFIEYLIRIPYGISETYIHPALDLGETRNITGTWQRRYWEYLILKDPEVIAAFKTHGVHLISYRDLVKLRNAGV
jgi:predicted glycoside hydrolase/deacetylase ChbG (UPF0249 family)